MELSLVLGLLKEGLKLWNTKESNKYLDLVMGLEKEYYEELSLNESDRSQLRLDSIMQDLESIAKNFLKYSGTK